MARILCAWEFGGDLGHVRRMLPIARELRAMGHEVGLAFRDLGEVSSQSLDECDWFQAPLLKGPDKVNPSPVNPSDILLNLGFEDSAGVAGALRAWLGLFSVWNPDLVVADYAPTALLAGRAANLARVSVGSGFSMPPPRQPLSALRDWIPTDEAVLAAFDSRLLRAIEDAFEHLSARGAAPRSAREIFDARARLVCTFPEIDPFGPRDDVEYLGSVGDSSIGCSAEWRGAGAPRVFAYLKPRDSRLRAIVQALKEVAGQAIVAAPGLESAQAIALSSDSVRVIPDAVNVDGVIAQTDLCICHSGAGLTARALVAGVPLALFPMQLEQFLVARRLAAAGLAAAISPDDPPPDFVSWLATILAREDLGRAARAWSSAHADYSLEAAATRAARRIAQALH